MLEFIHNKLSEGEILVEFVYQIKEYPYYLIYPNSGKKILNELVLEKKGWMERLDRGDRYYQDLV